MDSSRTAPRILVVGCGGIGGVVLSRLLEAGHPVHAVARREAIAQVLRERGPRLHDEKGERAVPGTNLEVFVRPPERGTYDFILLATPPTGVEEAVRDTRHLLAPEGAVVVLSNGLCEERVAREVEAERVIGAVVAWGASSPETGVYVRTATGGIVLGTLRGGTDARVERLAGVLRAVCPVELTTNLRGVRWSKLAINCAISSLGTVGGDRLGPLMRQRFVRRLGLEVITEVLQVARAEGVTLEKVAPTLELEWLALDDAERRARGSPSLLLKHAVLLAIGTHYRKMRSSMLAAIERGREPAVDSLNGEVVRKAQVHGIAVPVNTCLWETVHALGRHELKPGLDTLRAVYARTRSLPE
ncbi:ketopantoate reductase family protein [Archangium primigenium]|uniref:ketopantoate reductase family protein n=1 Tax=[Archangium] primigenium TaxID=2792470 RepID=UPI00195E8827|nr:2-dehydropantoate 2-reductase [Archangium primigenium]MBM7113589.1 2-dehydropantoate 2-reductase [Archangium primigenium]